MGLRWRPSALKKAAEIRVAGVVLQCDSEPKEINLDWGVAHQDAEPKDKEYKQFSCHAARQRVNMFSVWQNVKGWTGFEVLGCSSAPS